MYSGGIYNSPTHRDAGTCQREFAGTLFALVGQEGVTA